MSIMPKSLADGRYQLGQSIGHGGMAEVHVALDTRLGRTVAIKIMRADLANDQIFLSRFRREAQSVAKMNNPNIVNIYDSGEETVTAEDGTTERLPYLVMEYIKGQTLRDIIKANGALSQRDAEQVMLGVLSALEYSHRMGIIHRDIKPGNIMISEQGVVKVMDFGIARALDDSAATMTQSQGVVGTAQYLSPEQARGETVDMRSDLYSAGCVLYEMLTGRPPFTGDSAVAIAYQHVSEVATPPSAVVPGLPKMWDSICAKAMAKDRQNRYATAAEFRNDILTFMNGGMPVAAAFNPLTDLANVKARKQAEEQTATMPLSATVPMGAGVGAGVPGAGLQGGATPGVGETTATQAFNPVTGQFEVVPSAMRPAGAAAGSAVKSRAEQRAEAEQARRKKKRGVIIGAVIGVVALIAILLGVYFVTHGGTSAADEQVTVPDFTSMSNVTRDKVRSQLEELGLVAKITDDSTSDKPAGTVTKQNPTGDKKVDKGTTVEVWFSTGPATVSIPDVRDMTQDEARAKLVDAGFTVNSSVQYTDDAEVEQNNVVKTDPEIGSEQPKGTAVTLIVSSGEAKMPDVTNQPIAAAQKTLTDMGLTMQTIEKAYDDTVPDGTVISTNPSAGEAVDKSMTVTITVSQGPQPVTVPSCYAGQTYADCAAMITAAGLTPKASGPTDATAVVESIADAGKQVAKGTEVTVTTKAGTTDNNSNNGSDDNGSDDNSGSNDNSSTNNSGSNSNSGTTGNNSGGTTTGN